MFLWEEKGLKTKPCSRKPIVLQMMRIRVEGCVGGRGITIPCGALSLIVWVLEPWLGVVRE